MSSQYQVSLRSQVLISREMYQHCGNRKTGSAFKQFSGVKINFAKMKFFYHPEGISSIACDIPIQQYIYKAFVQVWTFDKHQYHHIEDDERVPQQYVHYSGMKNIKKQYQSYYQISSYRRGPITPFNYPSTNHSTLCNKNDHVICY